LQTTTVNTAGSGLNSGSVLHSVQQRYLQTMPADIHAANLRSVIVL